MVREDGITSREMGYVLRGEQLVEGIMVSTPRGRDALFVRFLHWGDIMSGDWRRGMGVSRPGDSQAALVAAV